MCKYKCLLILNLFFLLTLVQAQESSFLSPELEECEPTQFQCNNGSCIEFQLHCDQSLDCLDGSDEVGCKKDGRNHGLVILDNTTDVDQDVNNGLLISDSTTDFDQDVNNGLLISDNTTDIDQDVNNGLVISNNNTDVDQDVNSGLLISDNSTDVDQNVNNGLLISDNTTDIDQDVNNGLLISVNTTDIDQDVNSGLLISDNTTDIDQDVNNGLLISDNTTDIDQDVNNGLLISDNTTDVDQKTNSGPLISDKFEAVALTTNEIPQTLLSTTTPSPTLTKKPRTRKIPNKTSNGTKDVYEETLHLLEEGDKQIELRPDYRDIVLVAGLTGAGKTTIAKFIANPNDLDAYDNGERILIRDRVNDSISTDSTVVSHTIFPQLLIHGPSNTAFYDLPGFSDTRNSTIEIANAFFMKKVAEHAERIKILLIVSHNTLRSAGTRTEFKTLIENMIKFVKDIAKFSQSIVLVASKVEENRKTNDQVIRWIGAYLRRVDKDLPQIFQDPEKLQHAKSFLETLLEQDEETGEYTRIGMFRQPKIEGPLMDDRDFETNQIMVQNLVLSTAQFVPTSPGDFGFSVSAESTLFAKTLATKTKKKVDLLIEELTEVIDEELFEHPGNLPDSSSPWPSLRRWTRDFTIFHQMTNALDDAETCSTFFHVLNDTFSVFSIPSADDVILDLFKSNEQISFFDKISLESDAPPKQWTNSFDKLETKVGNKIRNMAEELNNHVTNITSAISSALKQQTINLMSTAASNATTGNTTILNRSGGNGTETAAGSNESMSQQFNKQTLFENLNEDLNSVNGMLSQILTTSTFAQFSDVTLNVLENTHLQVPPTVLTSLRDIHFDMNFNSGIKGQRFPFKPDIWIKPIEVLAVFLQSQIQTLSFQFSEETRRQNEARMNQQLETLREETKRAAEKAEDEAQRLAEEYRQREDSMNGSMTILADDLTKVRQEQKEEREEVQKQLQKREELFNANITKFREERVKEQQELKDQLQERERALNESLTDLREDYEQKRIEQEAQMERRQESFNRNLTAAREEQERKRNDLEIRFQERERTLNGNLDEMRKTHDAKRQEFEAKVAQDQQTFNNNLTAVIQEQEKERAALEKRRQDSESALNKNLTDMRKIHEDERKKFEAKVAQDQQSFNMNLTAVLEDQKKQREALEKRRQDDESALNKNLTEIRKTHKDELKKFQTQMEQDQQKFNTNLTSVIQEQEKERAALEKRRQDSESALNKNLTDMRKIHEDERKKFEEKVAQDQQSFNRSLAENTKQQEADQQLLQTRLYQQGQLLSGLNSTLIDLRAREEEREQQLERERKEALEKQRQERERQEALEKERQEALEKERQEALERERQEATRKSLEEEAKQNRTEHLKAGIFPKSERFDYNGIVSVEKRRGEVGYWGHTEYCPRDSIVTGYAVKYVPYIGGWDSGRVAWGILTLGISEINQAAKRREFDDYGVVGIKLFCTNVFNQSLTAEITSNYFSDSEMTERNGKSVNSVWAGSSSKSNFNCPDNHPAIGFQIRNEPNHAESNADNFGAINFRLRCSGPTPLLSVPDIPYKTVISPSWSEDVMCPRFAAVCGIETQIDKSEDGSGLTDVRLKCCKLSGT